MDKELYKKWNFPNSHEEIMSLIHNIPGIIYLEHQEAIIEGYKFFGSPIIPPVGEWAFMVHTEEDR